MKENMKEQLLTKRPIDLLFQLSIPAVIGMIVIGLYPLMDWIFVGKIIGQTEMCACGVALPLTFFIWSHGYDHHLFPSDWGWQKSRKNCYAKTAYLICTGNAFITKNIWGDSCLVGRTCC